MRRIFLILLAACAASGWGTSAATTTGASAPAATETREIAFTRLDAARHAVPVGATVRPVALRLAPHYAVFGALAAALVALAFTGIARELRSTTRRVSARELVASRAPPMQLLLLP